MQCYTCTPQKQYCSCTMISKCTAFHFHSESPIFVCDLQGGGTTNFLDRAVVCAATCLEESWNWGIDVDAWRAHLNANSWPEVLRQWGIVAGLGPQASPSSQGPETKDWR